MGITTRDEYDEAFALVKAAIADWDPYSLLATGSPDDEFDDQVARILAGLSDISSDKDLSKLVSAVFSASFEKEYFSPSDCAEVGGELFRLLRSRGVL